MYQQYINGKCVEGQGKPSAVYNPATGEIVGTVGTATAAQAQEALDAASLAFRTWSKTPLTERIQWMNRFREACIAEREKIVDLISAESGRTYALACADFDWCMISFFYYAEEARRRNGAILPDPAGVPGQNYHLVSRKPIGVTVGHLAWNYPLGNAGLKMAPAVASGCTCIIKPSSETPLATLYLGEIMERIGFPAGVINIVSGPSDEVGKTLNESPIPRMLSLIGSYETGLKIVQQGSSSIKKYSLELGGNAPVIVMDDVDPDAVAANIVAKKTGFAGQTCVNYNRIYVHERIYDALCEKIAEKLKAVRLGKGRDTGNIMGPMINRQARDRMLSLIDDAVRRGACLVTGGEIPAGFEQGCYITPALLKDVTDEMRVSKEEIFGPVIPVQPFSDFEQVLEQANRSIFGLSAYFFGHRAPDIAKAFETLEAGEIFVNGGGGTELSPHAGVKQSGVGCDKSTWSMDEYYDIKYLSMIP